ncbi:MAG: RusA family crossover junction endodeoxyribonuclease [Leptospiraceae bacterium]|nr:RusA family crossover junction endodeoxyribonuclease [Leptospiraceae bacterium]
MIEIEIKVSRVWSENSYLKPQIRKNANQKNFIYLYVSPSAKKYKNEVISKISTFLREKNITKPKSISAVYFVFYIKPGKKRRDTTNMVKLTEDALSVVLGIDDSVWDLVASRKIYISKKQKEEKIKILLAETPDEVTPLFHEFIIQCS